MEALVGRYAPIGLDALNAKAAMLERLDNKYVVRRDVLADALRELAGGFDVLQIHGRRAFTYDTCYFDDPSLSSYFDHHQGRRRRAKVRVRRYVDARQCFVEVKLKDRRGATVKRRQAHDFDAFDRLDAKAIGHVERAYAGLYGEPFGRPLVPVLRMTYRRMTLVARNGGERMTIDSGLRFFGDRASNGTDDDVFIVEAKSAHGHGIADRVLRGLHQHPTAACSKYCVGLCTVGAVERINRFLPALRKLGPLLLPMPAPRNT